MAHKKGVGSTDNGRDSKSKRLGVKLFGGQTAKAGNIIIRQRGTKYHPGENVYMGKDYTIHAKVDGAVTFKKGRLNRMFVGIDPDGAAPATSEATPTTASRDTSAQPAVSAAPSQDEVLKMAPSNDAAADADVTATTAGVTDNSGPVHLDDAPEMPSTAPGITDEAELAVAEPGQDGALNTADVTGSDRPSNFITPSGRNIELDDLTIIEGIGPKIAGILTAGGIRSWKALAEADVDFVKNLLDEAGPNFRIHNPATWAKQADLAVNEKWAELEQLQDELDGGKEK